MATAYVVLLSPLVRNHFIPWQEKEIAKGGAERIFRWKSCEICHWFNLAHSSPSLQTLLILLSKWTLLEMWSINCEMEEKRTVGDTQTDLVCVFSHLRAQFVQSGSKGMISRTFLGCACLPFCSPITCENKSYHFLSLTLTISYKYEKGENRMELNPGERINVIVSGRKGRE